MSQGRPRVISVRRGLLSPSGSWVYVWIDVGTGAIAYVGATGFDPELRAYLHVMSDDPQVGRVRASVPEYSERDFDVLAFGLPGDVDRQAVKRALTARLAEAGQYPGEGVADDLLREITDPILEAVASYRARTAADVAE